MRPPPRLTEIGRFPIVGGTALLALGATLAWKSKVNMDALTEGPQIADGEYWRLLTSILLHVDAFHLIFNLYWLWVLGSLVETIFGHLATLAIIVVLAAGSGAAEYAFLEGGVGLSGVGYGLFAMLWVLSRHDERFEDAVDKNTVVLFVAWFFICIFLTESDIMPVGNIAHGVGALLGALIGFAIGGPRIWRIPAAAGLVIAVTASVLGATVYRTQINQSSDRGLAEEVVAYKYLENGDNQNAVRYYRRAIALNPNEERYWHNLGVALYRLGNTQEANDAFKRAMELKSPQPADNAHGDRSD